MLYAPMSDILIIIRLQAAKTKAKKAKVVQYLDDRANEISAGLGYLSAGSMEQRHAEGKLVLVKFLKVLVENDGRLSGR